MSQSVPVQPRNTLKQWWNRAFAGANRALEMAAPLLPSVGQQQSTVQINGLTVRCDQTLPRDPQFLNDWNQLFARVATATCFAHPVWQQALIEPTQQLRRLRFFTAYRDQKLVGVLPMELRTNDSLRSCGTVMSDYLNPLIDPDHAGQTLSSLLTGIATLMPGHSAVLENIDPGTFSLQLNRLSPSSGVNLTSDPSCSVSRIALPNSWDAYLEKLDGHDRKELRRKIRKAEEQGAARLSVCKHPVTLGAELTAVLKLMEGAGGGKARKAKWIFPRFFQTVAGPLAQAGQLQLYKLFIEDKFAAAVISMPSFRGPILWNCAFDQSMRPWSPGIVLFGMVIRQAIEQGHSSIDLLRGQYEYKYRLGAVDHPLSTLTVSSQRQRIAA